MKTWSELTFWRSGECQVVLERLSDIRFAGKKACPARKDLFKALRVIRPKDVKVVLMGQDPYPNPKYATGLAFSIPEDQSVFPPTLTNLLKEYEDDLHYPVPDSGDLRVWCDRGVLLWNAIPSCDAGVSMSHDWSEWHLLTQELVSRLSKDHEVVFVFLGGVARRFSEYVEPGKACVELSHPSPRASRASHVPFLGSRMFSKVNSLLQEKGLEPIDWRLPCSSSQETESSEGTVSSATTKAVSSGSKEELPMVSSSSAPLIPSPLSLRLRNMRQ